jgi:hypothetical protein
MHWWPTIAAHWRPLRTGAGCPWKKYSSMKDNFVARFSVIANDMIHATLSKYLTKATGFLWA